MAKPLRPLIADANVLIDYMGSDPTVLSLLVGLAGELFVPAQVLQNVDGLDECECDRLGLTVVDPTLEQLLEAEERRGGLALDDKVCLLMARDSGWCCITNDRALRKACAAEGVPVVWGLEAMLWLVQAGALPCEDATSIATLIHTINPAYIGVSVLEDFSSKVRQLGSGPMPRRR